MNVAANFETENDLIKRKRVRHNPWQDATLLSVLIMQLCWLVPWYQRSHHVAGEYQSICFG